MSMQSNNIQMIMERINIVDFIGRYVDIKKVGKNYMAVCPFHNDKGPSMSISEDKGLFHCFGCGASGNVINFLMMYENIDFKEALIQLGKEANVEISFNKKNNKDYNRLIKINKKVSSYYHNNLLKLDRARDARLYLKRRKVRKDILEKFKIGYAQDDWHKLY